MQSKRNIFKRLSVKIQSKIDRIRIVNRIKKLRRSKKSDIERWKRDHGFYSDWNERTELLASFLEKDASIIEFGAGHMHLKTLLGKDQKYQPSDIVQRYPETLVCDLNDGITIDLSDFNTAVFSGVLEYIYDLEKLFLEFQSISSIQYIAISYCTTDNIMHHRAYYGWLSDYSKSELEAIFNRCGFDIAKTDQWKNQMLFYLVKRTR